MSGALEIKINGKRLMKALNAAPAELLAQLKIAGRDMGERFMGYHASQRLRGMQGTKGVRGSMKRGGFLVALGKPGSIRRVEGLHETTLDALKLKIRLASPIAVQHEVGQLLQSKQHRWMTVPMSKGPAVDKMGRKTAAGIQMRKDLPHIANAYAAGFQLRKRRKNGKSGGVLKGLFVVRHKASGKAFLARVVTKNGERRLVYWYHFIKSAQLKPRLDFVKLWNVDYRAKAIKRFNSAVGFALKAAREKAKAAGGAS